MDYYDTIIIGAGLAGCSLGKLLLEKRQKVLIFEKMDINSKSKLCGGILTRRSFKLLKSIYGDLIEDLLFNKIKEFIIQNNSVNCVFKYKNAVLYTIFRKDLDDFAVEQFTKNGGQIIDKTSYEKIDFQNNIVYANGKKYKYINLVGADGVFSQVRLDLTKKRQSKYFTIEKYLSKSKERLQLDFFDDLVGYTWIIPNSKNTILGIGSFCEKTDIKNIFMNHFKLDDKMNQLKGAFLPTGKDILLQKKNVYFIGDAAGLISPVTGEGIYYALLSADRLSKSISSKSLYRKSMIKEIIEIKIGLFTKKIVHNARLRNYLFNKFIKHCCKNREIDSKTSCCQHDCDTT